MRSGKIVFGVFTAFAAGILTGVLFAPAKGSVTRKKIARRGIGFAVDAKEKLNEYGDIIQDEFNTINESADDVVMKGKKKILSIIRTKHF